MKDGHCGVTWWHWDACPVAVTAHMVQVASIALILGRSTLILGASSVLGPLSLMNLYEYMYPARMAGMYRDRSWLDGWMSGQMGGWWVDRWMDG